MQDSHLAAVWSKCAGAAAQATRPSTSALDSARSRVGRSCYARVTHPKSAVGGSSSTLGDMNLRLLIFILALIPMTATARDACASLLPQSLAAELQARFPGYRLPESDNLPEDVKYAREHGGNACLGVGTGDFDGDGAKDYLIGLTSADGEGALVAVAFSRKSGWEFSQLFVSTSGRSRLYVEVDPPGTYERFGDADAISLEKGEVARIKCLHNVAVFGATESSGVAYCFQAQHWKHVWISD